MDKLKTAHQILDKALPHVPFDGWTQKTLKEAAVAAGYKKTDVIRVFPGGSIDAIDVFLRLSDQNMLDTMENYHLDNMKIRARITQAVRVKLETMAPHREALRKAIALHALPQHCHHGMRSVYETVDHMWYAIGDTSSDFNFYTKRLTLAGVYTSTLLHWLDDKSPAFESSWTFLDRRINNVMQFEKAKHTFRNWRDKCFV